MDRERQADGASRTSWPRPSPAASARRFRQALDQLLRAAQRAPADVRTDVNMDDVAALAIGCATLRATHRDRNGGARMVRLTLECLRAPSFVTQGPAFRKTTGPFHTASQSEECGAWLQLRPTGRPARYCGATCRQRAHRRRLGTAGMHA
ncbi:SbtR family transcriptional regulator [Streptomyces sp. NPDC001107]